jgi:hypothetical protein
MSVSNGQAVNAAVSNAAYMSRTVDTSTAGAITQSNTTQSTTKDTGAIVTEGGIGVEKNINAGGDIAATGTVTGSNLSGSNSGDVTLGAVGASPNANGASLSGQALTLQPADATNPGVITTGTQDIAGDKSFQDNVDVGGDLTVSGDLTVNGTTTTLNTATLDVEDHNVTLNSGGNDASSVGAGVRVQRTVQHGAITYDDSLVSKWKLGYEGLESEVITADDDQVIENKDLDGGTASETARITVPKNTTANLQTITRREGGIYYSTDEASYYGDDGSDLIPLGGGAGGAGINFLEGNNFDFETSDGDALEYADAAGAVPVDGTGGAPSVVSAFTDTAGEVIRGAGSLKFSKDAANRQGEGFGIAVAIPDGYADYPRNLVFQFAYRATANFDYGSGTTSDPSDVSIYFYDVTNSKLVYPDRSFLDGSGQHVCQVQFDSGTTSVRALWHVATTNAAAWDLIIDDVQLGPAAIVPQAIVTLPQTVTVTGTWVTNTTYTAKMWRVGKMARFSVLVETSGAPTSATLLLTLPVTIDTAYLSETSPSALTYIFQSSGVAVDTGNRDAVLSVAYQSTTQVGIVAEDAVGGAAVSQAIPFTWGAGDFLNVEFEVPVVGWDSGALVSVQDGHREVKCSAYRTAAASQTSTGSAQKFPFNLVSVDSHGKFDTTNNRYVAPIPGRYVVSAGVDFTANGTGYRALDLFKNGVAAKAMHRSNTLIAGTATLVQGTVEIDLVAGDYIEIFAYQSSGGNLAYTNLTQDVTYFDIVRVGHSQGVLSSEKITARYTTAAGQTVNNGANDIINFGTKDFDSHNAVTTGASWKFTAPASRVYRISSTVESDANTTTTGAFELAVYKNATRVARVRNYKFSADVSKPHVASITTSVSMNIGDYIDIRLDNTTGASRTLTADATVIFVDIESSG